MDEDLVPHDGFGLPRSTGIAPGGLLARHRLLTRLDARPAVTVVRAPIGFGKTTLLEQWTRRAADQQNQSETVAWVRVYPGCGDPASFWVSVIDALTDAGQVLPPLSEHRRLQAVAERMLTSPSPSPSPSRGLVLVVDRFENVTDPEIDAVLLDLVRHACTLRLVVCLRSHRHFSARLLTDVDATVITAHELLFTEAETATLCATVSPDLPSTAVEQVQAATGGWPEPTRTLVAAVRQNWPAPAGVTALANEIAYDYLRHRLLPEMNQPDRLEFTLLTSLPEEFTVSLAEALAGKTAKSHLDWLDGEGVLLAEGTGHEPVYRWPPAARTALRREAQYHLADRLPELHERLARYYLGTEQPGLALHHAVQARTWPLVLQVLESSWRQLLFAHRDELFEAFAFTPLDALVSSTRALALRDIRLKVPDDRLLGEAILPASLGELTELGRSERAADILDAGTIVTTALRRRGLFEQAHTYAARLAEIAAVARTVRPSELAVHHAPIQLGLGLGRLLVGDLTGALQPLELAHEFAEDCPREYVEADSASKLALAHAVLGEPEETERWLTRYRGAPLGETWLTPMIHTTATIARLLSALDRVDRPASIRAYRDLPAPPRIEEFWAYVLYAQAQYALHTGGADAMLDRLDRARTAHRQWLGHGAAAGPLLAAAEADLLLAAGRGNQAHVVLHAIHAGHPMLQVGAARLALLTGDHDAVTRLAADRGWERAATARDRLTMLLLHAVALHRSTDTTTAVDLLEQAATTADQTGLLRPFAAVPRADLADIAAAGTGRTPTAARLLATPALAVTAYPYPASVPLILLTEREQQILDKLADGLTVEQAAAAVVLSYNTVKTHIQSLYRKLGTDTRADALAKARQWGLLLDRKRTPAR